MSPISIIDIDLVLSKPADEVINSSLSLTLLKLYSILYNGGKQCRACAASQRSYYEQLKINGYKKLKSMQENLKKTCKLKTNDLLYISALAMHLSNINITDEIALRCLNKGILNEQDFEILPATYRKIDMQVIENEEIQDKEPQKRGRKPKTQE